MGTVFPKSSDFVSFIPHAWHLLALLDMTIPECLGAAHLSLSFWGTENGSEVVQGQET